MNIRPDRFATDDKGRWFDTFGIPIRDRRLFVATIYGDAVGEWAPVLDRVGIGYDRAAKAARRAAAERMPLPVALLTCEPLGEEHLYRAIADELGLQFMPRLDPARLVLTDKQCLMLLRRGRVRMLAKLETSENTTIFVVAPESIDWIRQSLERRPDSRNRIRVTTPSELRRVLMARVRATLSRHATSSFFERWPEMSARLPTTGAQGAAIGALLVLSAVCLLLAPSWTLTAIHAASTLIFLGCIGLRLGAALAGQSPSATPLLSAALGEAPTYTVLVALYREAAIVPDLIEALDRLVWPRGRLEIKLVCEADDQETIAAIREARPPPCVEIVEVPPSLPRTKPKALDYALPLSSGDFVVLYDAEDVPHPLQLIEAWQRFERSDGKLACLQAPLVISNADAGHLARLFAFEYSALFLGMLPWLEKRNPLLPLGGTSNHFRRDVLEEVGAWDPHNVTEDADLGLRLVRFGYRSETIGLPTQEAAPEAVSVWLPQRRRWLKGWAQTWLVHMRHPALLWRQVGTRSLLLAQVLFAGLLLSVLVHPLLLLTALAIVLHLVGGGTLSQWAAWMLTIDIVCVLGGYVSFLLLGARTVPRGSRRGLALTVLLTPAYWMLMSVAAWGAIWELFRRPHHWNKTPHPPRAAAATSIESPDLPR